jgi:hypothetical protein
MDDEYADADVEDNIEPTLRTPKKRRAIATSSGASETVSVLRLYGLRRALGPHISCLYKMERRSTAAISEVSLKSGLKNVRVPAKPKITPTTPPHLFPLHTLAAFIGARGSGKTNAAILLAHDYVKRGCFNRVFIISPTYDSNAAFHVLPVEKGDGTKMRQMRSTH